MNADATLSEYTSRYNRHLKDIASRLADFLSETLSDNPRVDRISARAKSPDRFIKKALKINDDGLIKYTDPLIQIQDQIGARVTVFYKQDVETISREINKYLRSIEDKQIVPDDSDKFGYVGKHFILFLPTDVIRDDADQSEVPQFFELQIKTLFQHAWSEAEHDLSYKSCVELTDLQKRQVAFTAAQAWGADEIFGQLFEQLLTSADDA